MADGPNSSNAPTAKARLDARTQGRIALSRDLASAIGFLGSTVALFIFCPKIFGALRDLMTIVFAAPQLHGTAGELAAPMAELGWLVCQCLFAIGGIVVFSWAVQTGGLVAVRRVMPDASRISPVAGCRRLISSGNAVSALLSLLKIVLITGAGYLIARYNYEEIALIGHVPFELLAAEIGTQIYQIALVCTAPLILIGVIDYIVKRGQFENSLRRSDDESRENSSAMIRSISSDQNSTRRYAPAGRNATDAAAHEDS